MQKWTGAQLVVLGVLLAVVAAGSFYAGSIYRREGVAGTVWLVVKNEVADNMMLLSENLAFSRGETVFDILTRVADVEYKTYPGMGVFVISIENVRQTEKAWWLYQVNGVYPNIAADKYAVADGDNILWKFTSEWPTF